MRKFILAIVGISLLTSSLATTSLPYSKSRLKASEIFFPVGKTGQTISLLELSRIKIKDLQKLTGHKMDIFDRLSFTAAQKRVKNMINLDGTINTKKIERYSKRYGGETGFHIGGFALGFFLGVIGVLIAYLIKDDYKRNRVKWAWIGWGAWVVIWVTLLLTIDFNQD